MKALIQNGYGSVDTYSFVDLPKPRPKTNEVLVKIVSTALNDWELGVLAAPAPVRLLLGWKKPKGKFRVMGCDMAGRIEAIGADVTHFKVGDEVFGDLSGYRFGGFAEYVCVTEKHIYLKPVSMSFEQAAALPHAGELAMQALALASQVIHGQKGNDEKDIESNEARKKVLVNGAGGGVGTLLIQLLKPLKLETTGVDSGSKLESLRALGYQAVIDYQKVNFTQTNEHYDVIIDTKTCQSAKSYQQALAPGGIYVTVGGKKLIRFLLMSLILNRFSSKRLKILALKTNHDLEKLCTLFLKGELTPAIDRVVPFYQIKDALRYFERAEQVGKVIVKIAE